MYEIGVCDNGLLLGIDREEMDASLRTLECMADGLGAVVRIVREVEVAPSKQQETTKGEAPPALSIPEPSQSSEQHPALVAASIAANLPLPVKQIDPAMLNVARRGPSKKMQRAMRREADFSLRYGSSAETAAPSGFPAAEEVLDEDEQGFLLGSGDDESGDGDGDAVLSGVEGGPSASTDDVPALSHSPSPPRSISIVTATHSGAPSPRRFSSGAQSTSGSQVQESSTSDGDQAPCQSPPENAVEDEAARIRRHLRKQWKKERTRQKQYEARAAREAAAMEAQGRFYKASVEDRFMDGLICLFDGIHLDPLALEAAEADAEARAIATAAAVGQRTSKKAGKKLKKWRHRVNEEKTHAAFLGAVGAEHSSAIDIVGSAPIPAEPILVAKPQEYFAVPPPRNPALRRFVVECLVYYKEDEEGEEGEPFSGIGELEEDEPVVLALADDAMPASVTVGRPRLRSTTSSNGAPRKPSYIDFENAF